MDLLVLQARRPVNIGLELRGDGVTPSERDVLDSWFG